MLQAVKKHREDSTCKSGCDHLVRGQGHWLVGVQDPTQSCPLHPCLQRSRTWGAAPQLRAGKTSFPALLEFAIYNSIVKGHGRLIDSSANLSR